MFGGIDVPGSNNRFMDFGLDQGAAQWEIAEYREGTSTCGIARIAVDEMVKLKVQRRNGTINCYVKEENGNWELDYTGTQGNYVAGQFSIGNDGDSLAEYFRGEVCLNDCYLLQENPNSAQPLGKYVLRQA